MAVKSPLLDIDLEGAKRVLFVVTGGPDMTLKEVYETSGVIHEVADPDANIIFGTCKDPSMTDQIKVTMVASAFPMESDGPTPVYDEPLPELHKTMSVPPSEDPNDCRCQASCAGRPSVAARDVRLAPLTRSKILGTGPTRSSSSTFRWPRTEPGRSF